MAFHGGPGHASKAIGGDRVSLLSFGLTQVAICIEPLIGLLRGASTLRGWTHTLAGATAIAALVACVGTPFSEMIPRARSRVPKKSGLARLRSAPSPDRFALLSGALLGAWTHVLLDGVMHIDLHWFAPRSQAQPWWRVFDIGALHLGSESSAWRTGGCTHVCSIAPDPIEGRGGEYGVGRKPGGFGANPRPGRRHDVSRLQRLLVQVSWPRLQMALLAALTRGAGPPAS